MRPPLRTASSFGSFGVYCLFTPFCTAPVSLAEPVLFGPAAVPAPEVLASPLGEGLLLAPVVPCCIAPLFIAPSDAPGPTLPWLDAPGAGWAVCAKAAGVASAKMQADVKRIFFIGSSLSSFHFTRGKLPPLGIVPVPGVAIGRRPPHIYCVYCVPRSLSSPRTQRGDR
jgi:hypothetical protein